MKPKQYSIHITYNKYEFKVEETDSISEAYERGALHAKVAESKWNKRGAKPKVLIRKLVSVIT